MNAYDIFLHTRAAVSAAQYPSQLSYVIVVSGYRYEALRTNHYTAYYDEDGKLFVNPISSEEAAQPVTPHGANWRISLKISWNPNTGGKTATGYTAPLNAEGSADLLGVPMLSPNYMFGMRYQSVASPSPVPSTRGLQTIAVVAAGRPDYAVALLGTSMIGESETYELKLTPLQAPTVNRIRMLWVGVNDYLPRKAIVAGNFTLAPLVDVPWTIEFAVVNNAPFITDEIPDQTLFMAHHVVVHDASIRFENIHESDDDGILHKGPLLGEARVDVSLSKGPLFPGQTTNAALVEP